LDLTVFTIEFEDIKKSSFLLSLRIFQNLHFLHSLRISIRFNSNSFGLIGKFSSMLQ